VLVEELVAVWYPPREEEEAEAAGEAADRVEGVEVGAGYRCGVLVVAREGDRDGEAALPSYWEEVEVEVEELSEHLWVLA